MFLLTLSVGAADAPISPRQDSLQAFALYNINVDGGLNNQISAANVHWAVNRAQAKVATDLESITKDTVVSLASTPAIQLPADCGRVESVFRKIYLEDIDDTVLYPIKIIDADSLQSMGFEQYSHDKSKWNSINYCVQHGQSLIFFPQYRADKYGSEVFLTYYATGDRLAAASDTTLIQPQHREAIILYTTFLLYSQLELYAQSSFWLSLYAAEIEDKNKRSMVSYQEIKE